MIRKHHYENQGSGMNDIVVLLPSVFDPIKSQYNEQNTINLNQFFWKWVFSKDFVLLLQSHCFPDNAMHYQWLNRYVPILDNIYDLLMRFYESESNFATVEYTLRLAVFYLAVVNDLQDEFILSLSGGVTINKNREAAILRGNSLYSEFLTRHTDLFAAEGHYRFDIYSENEIFTAALVTRKMKSSLSRSVFNLNCTNGNEQIDFSSYVVNKTLAVDFDNILYNKDEPGLVNKTGCNQVFGKREYVCRLFASKCFWNKCVFCAINSGRNEEKKYTSVTEEVQSRVREILSIIRNRNIEVLVFTDEAIARDILFYLADEFIKNNIHVVWRARTRLDESFMNDNLATLAASGLTFLGIGLETVNGRVASLMNKRDFFPTSSYLLRLTKRFSEADINLHYYMIIGFPGESKRETMQTISFMKRILRNDAFISYSANVFFLMKGSRIYNQPDKFNIDIDPNHPGSTDIPFIDKNRKRHFSRKRLFELSERMYSRQFHIDEKDRRFGFQIWSFLDRTGLFYSYKAIFRHNPFNVLANERRTFDRDKRYRLLPILFTGTGSTNPSFYDFIERRLVKLPGLTVQQATDFRSIFNESLTLSENIQKASVDTGTSTSSLERFCRQLLRCSILVPDLNEVRI